MKRIKKCPACGSGNLMLRRKSLSRGTFFDACRDCAAIWESIPEGEHFKRDGELLAFHQPCDNCAFRPGSPESEDKKAWRELIEKLRDGGHFFCHKGVPILELGAGSAASFDFPKGPDGKEDINKLRFCRGYLNAWLAWMRPGPGT
jgi:hypothetical protein